MSELINRQMAIDAIGALSDAVFKNIEKGATFPKRQWFDGMANAESIIKDLPSVQPVITCDGCRFVGTYDTDFPCCGCVRREKDYYEPER